jgi:membrane protease YdiL (CAAX protease family)
LCFAVVPALCEEVLFRGAILSILLRGGQTKSALSRVGAVLLCGLLFGIFHLSRAKFLPTTLLGISFGAGVLLSGSLWSAIAMHCTNNALVVLLVRAGFDEAPESARVLFVRTAEGASRLPGPGPGLFWLGAALVLGLAGYGLLRLAKRRQN